MGALELRGLVHDYINNADERLLRVIKAVVESYKEEETDSGFIEQYNADIDQSEKEIESGEFFTHEQILNKARQWGGE